MGPGGVQPYSVYGKRLYSTISVVSVNVVSAQRHGSTVIILDLTYVL